MRYRFVALLTFAATALVMMLPGAANAWWNKDWTQRTRITLNTGAQGLETKAAVTGVTIAVRLHSGNFDFAGAKEDGSDLRVVAADDKTPLKFSVERFDGIDELAVLWVQVPSVAPGSDKNLVYVYAGNARVGSDANAASGFDSDTLAAFHFSDAGATAADPISGTQTAAPVTIEPNGLLAASARLDGKAFVWPGSDKLRIDAGGALTMSIWVRADDVASATIVAWGPVTLGLQGGKLVAKIGAIALTGGGVVAATWTQVALSVGAGKARLFVNGLASGETDAALPALGGELRMGEGLKGLADELQIARVARPAEWLLLAAGAQGADSKLVASVKESAASEEAGSPGYFGILVKNLTADAWVIIAILGVMLVIAIWVMVTKAIFIVRADKDNRLFLRRFRGTADDLLGLEAGAAHPNSSLHRLYVAGLRELRKRRTGDAGARPLSGASINAVKASVDADLVRETHALNSRIVLLTIAISGGPFLGLLGTVVGVMITFAAIAAAGDVNVNAIAPGIAAALLATVAGLAVAIPALFGYNYLASRIKNISSDMQIFVDEFITRVAEVYGA
jgi:biopolymer transport protein ExbB